MRKITRTIIVGLMTLLVALTGPAATTPALAATLTVGCPGSIYTGATGIQDAVNAAPTTGATITVCAGLYDPVNVTKDNIHLKGKDNPIIRPAAPGFVGNIVQFGEVVNASIEGFTIDGGFNLSNTTTDVVRGILFFRSTGTISKNTIIHIRRDPVGTDALMIGIDVENGLPGPPLPVKVIGNTVYDYQHVGIYVFGNINPTIQKNVVAAKGNTGAPSGITLDMVGGGMVSGNIIQSDYFYWSGTGSTGITLAQTSNVKVTSNKIKAVTGGILLVNWCPSSLFNHTANNTIMGNTITQAFHGVILEGIDNTAMGTNCDGNVDNNKITKNKITSMGYEGVPVYLFLYTLGGSTYSPKVTNNTTASNTTYGFDVGIVDSSGSSNTNSPNTYKTLPPGVYP